MSGTISRSTSLQSPEEGMVSGAGARADPVAGVINSRGPGPSPLQHFVQAKKKINEIFREVEGYVGETEEFLVNIPQDAGVAEQEVQEAAKEFGKISYNYDLIYVLSYLTRILGGINYLFTLRKSIENECNVGGGGSQ